MIVTFSVSARPEPSGDLAGREDTGAGDALTITRALTARGHSSLTIGAGEVPLLTSELTALADEVLAAAASADWIVLCGPLATNGAPDLYPALIRRLKAGPARVALNTDWAGVRMLVDSEPDLVVLGYPELEQAAGFPVLEPWEALAALEPLRDFGRTAVLAGLRADGAVLSDRTGSYHASAPSPAAPSRDRLAAGFLAAGARGRSALVEGMAWAAGVERAAIEHTWVDTLELTRAG